MECCHLKPLHNLSNGAWTIGALFTNRFKHRIQNTYRMIPSPIPHPCCSKTLVSCTYLAVPQQTKRDKPIPKTYKTTQTKPSKRSGSQPLLVNKQPTQKKVFPEQTQEPRWHLSSTVEYVFPFKFLDRHYWGKTPNKKWILFAPTTTKKGQLDFRNGLVSLTNNTILFQLCKTNDAQNTKSMIDNKRAFFQW